MANNRVYELMYIAEPNSDADKIAQINKEIEELIEGAGSTIVSTEDMGRRQLAYSIKKNTEGYYYLFEIESSGKEIAEVERRMRVNDSIIRYLTVRVDEERKTADKIEAKRERRKNRAAELSSGKSEDKTGEEE
ncbi:MAG: 30S ribosomal protein S6 [Aridibacter sp.]